MDGVLIIDKPAGITSHDAVARCRRILRTKRVGHTGTLDPFATGVMVILVGRATRLAQFLDKDAKSYEALVRLGFETDTGDGTGELRMTNYQLRDVCRDEIETVLRDFRGEIRQTPPMYSAKKIEGKKLYELARKGLEIEREAVKITNYELRITNFGTAEKANDSGFSTLDSELPATFDFGLFVSCSAGTYIRVLAEDIGRKLGTGAHLAGLRRTRAGKFGIEQAVTLEQLEKIAADRKIEGVLISMNEAVSHLAEIRLSAEEIGKIKNGVKLEKDLRGTKNETILRLTDDAENLLAVAVYDETKKLVRPKIVLV